MKLPFSIDIKLLLIISLLLVVFTQRCNPNNPIPESKTITIDNTDYTVISKKTDTIYIEKRVEILKYVPKYITKVDTFEVTIPTNIDTIKILENYLSTYRVIDTLKLVYDFSTEYVDSSGKLPNANIGYGVITDDISKNTIIGRSIIWNYKIPYIKDVTIVKDLPKNQLYIGINTNFTKQNLINSFGVGTLLKTKRDNIYQLNAGFVNNFNGNSQLYAGGGLYWKLKLKK
jgi:hypothetical protein